MVKDSCGRKRRGKSDGGSDRKEWRGDEKLRAVDRKRPEEDQKKEKIGVMKQQP